jgi:hypothetical protein
MSKQEIAEKNMKLIKKETIEVLELKCKIFGEKVTGYI